MAPSLAELRWDNSFAGLPERLYQRVALTPLANARLAAFNPDAAALLGLDPAAADDPDFARVVNGEIGLEGGALLAAGYAGHQFGVWVPELGDGRAVLLGEVIGAGHRRWDVQVKGGGLTRFSRMGDGRAVLRSTVREYLGSEAMHGLGIPTTRALAIVTSDTAVYREEVETGALLVRLAPTHIRFGSFEWLASLRQEADLKLLADYVIDQHFPHLLAEPAPARYAAWYGEVIERTAQLMAAWTACGFTHGVMNTDNMSILGLTLDYGPYGWMERYDRGWIPNHTDSGGRYAYDQQPRVGLWNCARLGEALHPLMEEADAIAALERYRPAFEREMERLMHAKLGLRETDDEDLPLIADTLDMLNVTRADYTRFFRALSQFSPGSSDALRAEVRDAARLDAWLARYALRLLREDSVDRERQLLMRRANPKYVLRNWIAQQAIDAARNGAFAVIEELRRLFATPFDEHPGYERFAGPAPAGVVERELSCSS